MVVSIYIKKTMHVQVESFFILGVDFYFNIGYNRIITKQGENMKKQSRKAYNELAKKGYAVEDIDHQSGEFQIWCDGAEDRKGVGDYYARGNPNNTEIDDFGIYKEVVEILDKHGMWAEWINAEMASINLD